MNDSESWLEVLAVGLIAVAASITVLTILIVGVAFFVSR